MGNLDLWKKLATPPSYALKEIRGGRLKGMTDIRPQWRYMVMTDLFGPCGKGWRYTIDKLWTEPGPDGEVLAFALVSVYVMVDGIEGMAIPGIGGSMLVEAEKMGLHTNDEGFKMAVTDALSVALKMVGVGADIYMGQPGGSKYKDPDVETLGDFRDKNGNYAPAIKQGEIAQNGDGTRMTLRKLWGEINDLQAARLPGGPLVFSPEEIKEIECARHPGGEDKPPATKETVALLERILAEWGVLAEQRIDEGNR